MINQSKTTKNYCVRYQNKKLLLFIELTQYYYCVLEYKETKNKKNVLLNKNLNNLYKKK